MWSLGGAICECTCDTLCGHLGTCVKITKSRVGLRVRNSDFPCVHSPSHCDFTSVSCERRTFKFVVMLLLFLGISLLVCSLEADLPRAPVRQHKSAAQVSCDAEFPYELRPQRPHGAGSQHIAY